MPNIQQSNSSYLDGENLPDWLHEERYAHWLDNLRALRREFNAVADHNESNLSNEQEKTAPQIQFTQQDTDRIKGLFMLQTLPLDHIVQAQKARQQTIARLIHNQEFLNAARDWNNLAPYQQRQTYDLVFREQLKTQLLPNIPRLGFRVDYLKEADFPEDLGNKEAYIADYEITTPLTLETHDPPRMEHRIRVNKDSVSYSQVFLYRMHMIYHEGQHGVQGNYAYASLYLPDDLTPAELEVARFWHLSGISPYDSGLSPFYKPTARERDAFYEGVQFATDLGRALKDVGLDLEQPKLPSLAF